MNDKKKPQKLAPASPSGAQTPIELKGTKQRKRFKVAAGLKAVEEVLEYGLSQSGLKNTLGTFHKLNQTTGFDCQSCAWPNPDNERSFAEFCENGFKAVTYEATTKLMTPEFFREHSVAELLAQSDHWLGHQGRITEPMVLRPGATHYTPITWDESFRLIADELKALNGPNEAVFYTSGRTSNETAFLYQLFVRAYGTNNLPDCSNMCHESTSVALPPMIGIGKGCVKLSDLEKADAIFIAGQNPGTNHPRMLTALQKAKERGCKIVFINPLPETGGLWQNLGDPHGIAVTTGIQTGAPVGFVVSDQSQYSQGVWVARIDLSQMLQIESGVMMSLTSDQMAPAVTILDATRTK